jgi:small subunit ribosomal protein S1
MDEKRAYATGDADFSFVDKRGDSEKQIVVPRQDDTDDIQDFGKLMGLYEESLESIQEGEIVKGQIVHIDNEHVSVDIGYKSEGQIPIREFMDLDGNLTARVGDEVEVLLERKEDRNERIILSREKAAKIDIWDEIKEACENDRTISGRIVSRVRGGLLVDIGLEAFLPGSQIDLRPVRDMAALVGTAHDFKILKYNKRRGNIVLSRRAILEAERAALKKRTLVQVEKGAILHGKVKNIADYGLFIDLGGIDGLVHVSDMSWGRIGHPSEMHQIGDEIKVKVINFDRQQERISLGIKQLTPDPWKEAEEKYTVGTRIKGRVVSLKDYGAFVEVEEGAEGLLHVSKMSWSRKLRYPSDILNVGDIVEVIILDLDVARKRISLGLHQLEKNPWDIIGEKYPVGTTVKGKIKKITGFGIFVGTDESIDGLVHISDISWSRRIKHPSEVYREGQEVQAVVLEVDKEKERFLLGIKQLTSDPWDKGPETYMSGMRVTGTVSHVTDFGLFVELEEGIEGLIHESEIPGDRQRNALSQFQVDDVIQATVVSVSPERKRIGLSIRKLEEENKMDMYRARNYLSNHEIATSEFDEILSEEMLELQQKTFAGSRKYE